MFDASKHKLRLIDWGLADFYEENKEFNVNVCALYYKGPEVLLNYSKYDYSLDMWGVGVTLA